jgi:hypothetical protein
MPPDKSLQRARADEVPGGAPAAQRNRWTAMNRIAVARAVSTIGHPVVVLLAAALVAASSRGATSEQLRLIGGVLVLLSAVALGFSWYQVRTGRWAHIDASNKTERVSLNAFLAILLLLSGVVLSLLTHLSQMSIALALSGALATSALLLARWIKVSLHTAFAALATTLVWPIKFAVAVGIVVTASVVWSRMVLDRHVAADVVVGLLLGIAAGLVYRVGTG